MPVTPVYTRRKPEEGILYNAVCQEWPKIRAMSKAANDGHGLPDFIEDAVDDYRKCGILKHGFLHIQCCSCKESQVIAFSCKQTGLCNSCDGRVCPRYPRVWFHWRLTWLMKSFRKFASASG